ncbi:ribonuclease H-like domain-containing protein [Tanacetum coccineum]
MHRNLVPPPKVEGSRGLVIREPESGIFFYNGNFDLIFQREEFHLATTAQLIRTQSVIHRGTPEAEEMFKKMELTIEARNDVAEARRNASTGIEGLAECKASASNLRRIQVKDIVKEVEDYLKTYSSAEMDINWILDTSQLPPLRIQPRSICTSSNCKKKAIVLLENTNSTNEVSTAYGVSHSSGHCLKHEQPSTSSYSLLASQSSCPQLDHEDLDQVDEYDLEEMDLKWQVAMISMRINKFQKKTGRKLQFDAKEPVGFDKTKVECFKCHKTGHFARECRTKEENRKEMMDGILGIEKGEELAIEM